MQDKLIKLQNELKAPKNQYNSFGKYKYRNQEDILEAVKPLLYKYGLQLTLSDRVNTIGDVIFIEAEATVTDGNHYVSSKAQAGINTNKKGMDISQSFGSSSSYARKYALNGLFLIDDTKDADSTNVGNSETEKVWLNKNTPQYNKAVKFIQDGGDIELVLSKYKMKKEILEELQKIKN